MYIRADFHQHLQQSPNFSTVSFNKIIDLTRKSLCQDRYPGMLGLVNFQDTAREDHRYEQFINLLGYDRQNLNRAIQVKGNPPLWIIKVQEIPLIHEDQEVHVLAIGIPEKKQIKPRMNLQDTMKAIQDLEGILVWDHPFSTAGIGKHLNNHYVEEEILSQTDALEIYNGLLDRWIPGIVPSRSNKKAINYYRTKHQRYPHLGALAGSDGQTITALKNPSYTDLYFQGDLTKLTGIDFINEVRERIRAHRFMPEKTVSQPRSEVLKHAFGIIKEEGLGKTLKRYFIRS